MLIIMFGLVMHIQEVVLHKPILLPIHGIVFSGWHSIIHNLRRTMVSSKCGCPHGMVLHGVLEFFKSIVLMFSSRMIWALIHLKNIMVLVLRLVVLLSIS